MKKREFCPKCSRKLHYRKKASGYVCTNERCDNYWNFGEGPVLSYEGK